MNPVEQFEIEKKESIRQMGRDEELLKLTNRWFLESCRHRYSYNFSWMGRPIIQFPQDIVAMQEIIFQVKPDLIIETGIAHGGSIVFYASMLELLGNDGHVLGVDIEIRPHNRQAIEAHPMFKRITMFEGSSIDPDMVSKVKDFARNKKHIMIVLDSNHTHEHVLQELQAYSSLVTKGSYLVVFDTVIEDMPDEFFPDRPWNQEKNPATAVKEFLKTNDRFQVDTEMDNKLLISVAPGGYLKCIKE